MNLLEDDRFQPWQSEAFYQAARRRRVTVIGGAELSVIEVNAGGQLLAHVQPRFTFYSCICGEGSVTLEEQDKNLQWGDVLEVPARKVHAFATRGTTPLVLLVLQPLGDEPLPPEGLKKTLIALAGRLR